MIVCNFEFGKGDAVKVCEPLLACADRGKHRLHTLLPGDRLRVSDPRPGEVRVEVTSANGDRFLVARLLLERAA